VEIKQHTKAPRKIKASAAPVGETVRRAVMPEPRDDDDIALGLDEDEYEDETYDTLEEKYE
jgi:hypothetical protein